MGRARAVDQDVYLHRTGIAAPKAPAHAGTLPPAHAALLSLQRSAGNAAVAAFLSQARREVQRQPNEPAGSGGVATATRPEPVTDAPVETYVVPFDHAPLSAPGERIIFRAVFQDPTPGDYRLEYTTTLGNFTSKAGPAAHTVAGLDSGNVDFFIPKAWNGTTALQVELKVRKISDNSVAQTETWSFGRKTRFPKKMSQVEGTGERGIPAVYTYDIGPAVSKAVKPYYEHQTILERFGNWRLANIKPKDIASAYRKANGLKSKSDVSQHFLGNYAGNNGTFTVDDDDQIADRHGGHPNLANLEANMPVAKDIEVELPQTYEAKPGKKLGRYLVTRVLKTDGSWKVKKAKR